MSSHLIDPVFCLDSRITSNASSSSSLYLAQSSMSLSVRRAQSKINPTVHRALDSALSRHSGTAPILLLDTFQRFHKLSGWNIPIRNRFTSISFNAERRISNGQPQLENGMVKRHVGRSCGDLADMA
jgi:hypothetical protein